MKPRISILIIIYLCLIHEASAQTLNPFGLSLQYSTVLVASLDKGPTLTEKLFVSDGKMRTEMTLNGETAIGIIRPDLKMDYIIVESKKTILEAPLNSKSSFETIFESGQSGSLQLLGTETVEGIPCIKSKVLLKSGDSYVYWSSVADRTPVKLTGDNPKATFLWKDYQKGAQDESLFELPVGFHIVPFAKR